MKFRNVDYSKMTITELMIPAYANFSGKIHGGILLSLMDKVAYACASKHSGKYCVTVSVDGVEFLQPVEVGEMVSLLASVNHVGKSSMVIGIKVIAENFQKGTVKHTNTSYFTMVAKDEKGVPTAVPGLELSSREEVRRFMEAMKRKELKARYKVELDNTKTDLEIEANLHLLEQENCKLNVVL
ncbi:MAG: acyl-CoA thioesterase [Flavobacteriales bacterium]|nr:acyl-CoA thioesterase [Flavobacteriales bacterium]